MTDGETGILFRTADIEDLARRPGLAARDPALRSRIGDQARKRVSAHSLDRIVPRYEEISSRRSLNATAPRAPDRLGRPVGLKLPDEPGERCNSPFRRIDGFET